MADLIFEPGIYDMTAERYHSDPVVQPSLSASIASILLSQSPRHAWTAHKRLNPQQEDETKKHFDIGSAFHALVLGEHDKIQVINEEAYRSSAAKAARDAAYAANKIPVLMADMVNVNAMHAAVRAQLAVHQDASDAFTDGKPEQTLVWQERGIWCRARVDWRPNDPNRAWDDLKTSSTSANPDAWSRKLYDMGSDVQCAFYRRGIRALLGVDNPPCRFVVIETEPPYALSVIALTPAALDLADRKVDAAVNLWAECLKNDAWPGYPARTCFVDPPIYQERAWLEREGRDDERRSRGKGLTDEALHWQAPKGFGA